ncbi:MAG: LysR family transcriptional regulator [Cumulibacter sp.]
MELRHVRALVAVAEHQHFSRAAESLRISQPPLSAAIREFEREVGVVLFERTTRTVRLTDDGAALLEPARRILESVGEIRQIAAARRTGTAGSVRAGFAGTSGYAILADLVREVRSREPGLTVDLVPQVYSGRAIELVRRGQLDLAITGSPLPTDLGSVALGQETLVLAVPEGHPLSTTPQVAVASLAGEPLVSYPGEHDSWVRHATVTMLESAGIAPNFVAEAPDPFSLLALVAAGVGAAVVVDHRDRLHVAGVHYLPLADDVQAQFPIRLVWRAGATNPATRRAVTIAREVFDASAPAGRTGDT